MTTVQIISILYIYDKMYDKYYCEIYPWASFSTLRIHLNWFLITKHFSPKECE